MLEDNDAEFSLVDLFQQAEERNNQELSEVSQDEALLLTEYEDLVGFTCEWEDFLLMTKHLV